MDRFTDYFHLLEVDQTTSKADIKKAFMAKALIFHPDKAKSQPEKLKYTKIYENLQTAYRILSSDASRKQYIDANQKTNLDLIREDRDVTYHAVQVKKDFHKEFEASRSKKNQEQAADLTAKYKGSVLRQRDVANFLAQRNMETLQISEYIREGTSAEPVTSRVVQEYTEPIGYSTGLMEASGIHLEGVNFDNIGIHNIIPGDIIQEHTVKPLLSSAELMDKIKTIQLEREEFMKLPPGKFKNVPSEIEKTYSELFRADVEGIGRK